MFINKIFKNYFQGFYNLNKKYNNNLNLLNKTMLDIIKKRRMDIEKISNNGKDRLNLIDVLLALNSPNNNQNMLHAEEESPMTDQEISTTLLDVSVAGIE